MKTMLVQKQKRFFWCPEYFQTWIMTQMLREVAVKKILTVHMTTLYQCLKHCVNTMKLPLFKNQHFNLTWKTWLLAYFYLLRFSPHSTYRDIHSLPSFTVSSVNTFQRKTWLPQPFVQWLNLWKCWGHKNSRYIWTITIHLDYRAFSHFN